MASKQNVPKELVHRMKPDRVPIGLWLTEAMFTSENFDDYFTPLRLWIQVPRSLHN